MPELSRFAVMQHLDVLTDASLVLVRRDGRQRFNFANAAPIQEVYDRWVSGFSSAAAETAQHLKRYAESKEKSMSESQFRVVKIELEVEIAATPEVVFRALTTEMDSWWPHRMKPGSTIRHDAELGGIVAEVWDGGGAIYGHITAFDPGRHVGSVVTGFMGAYSAANDDVVEARGDGAVYKKSLKLWGDVPPELEQMFREGSAALMKQALKAYCEEGKGYVG
jgi:DNA-binding transcriptional ArsR family regulator